MAEVRRVAAAEERRAAEKDESGSESDLSSASDDDNMQEAKPEKAEDERLGAEKAENERLAPQKGCDDKVYKNKGWTTDFLDYTKEKLGHEKVKALMEKKEDGKAFAALYRKCDRALKKKLESPGVDELIEEVDTDSPSECSNEEKLSECWVQHELRKRKPANLQPPVQAMQLALPAMPSSSNQLALFPMQFNQKQDDSSSESDDSSTSDDDNMKEAMERQKQELEQAKKLQAKMLKDDEKKRKEKKKAKKAEKKAKKAKKDKKMKEKVKKDAQAKYERWCIALQQQQLMQKSSSSRKRSKREADA
jgi:hypothetical protein